MAAHDSGILAPNFLSIFQRHDRKVKYKWGKQKCGFQQNSLYLVKRFCFVIFLF